MLEFAKLLRTKLGSNVRAVLAHVASFGTTGNDADAEQHEDCEVVQPIGLAARPVIDADSEAVILRDGDEVVILGMVRKSSTVHDVEEGETQLFSDKEPTCRIRLRANGDIEILPKSGQKVYVGAASGTGGMEPVGLGTSIKNQLDSIRNIFNAHTHTGVQTGAGSSGVPAALIGATPDVEADNVNVK